MPGEFSRGDKCNPDGFAGVGIRIRDMERLQFVHRHELYGVGIINHNRNLHR
jgi:hypothetical protein